MATYKEIHGVKVQYRDSDATAIEGDVWYNRSTGKLKMYITAGAWSSGGNINQGKQVSHAKHADIYNEGKPDERIITSVFNFHTCNGSTVVGKKNISSKANRLILFDNTIHYGITQSDLSRRIVLNINELK